MYELLQKQRKTYHTCMSPPKPFHPRLAPPLIHESKAKPYIARMSLLDHDPDGSTPLQQGAPTCGCNPCPFYPCKSIRPGNKDIINAFNLAQAWLGSASNKLDAYLTKTPPPLNVTQALAKHFGASLVTAPNVKAIKADVDKLNASPAATSPINGNCQPKCPAGKAGSDTFATSPLAWNKTNCYEFCDPFFSSASADLRAKIAVHEMAHSWLGCQDHAYEGDQNYPPVAALNNADSYACLVRDLK